MRKFANSWNWRTAWPRLVNPSARPALSCRRVSLHFSFAKNESRKMGWCAGFARENSHLVPAPLCHYYGKRRGPIGARLRSHRLELVMPHVLGRWSFAVGILSVSFLCFAQFGASQPPGNSGQIQKDFAKSKPTMNEYINSDKKKEKDFAHDVLDGTAKYWAYRILWPWVLEAKAEADGKEKDSATLHMKHFDDHIKLVLNNKELIKVYSPVLVTRFKEMTDLPVLENSRSLTYITHMLPSLARLQDESISKYLLEILDPKNDKHDIIKLGAVRGLGKFMPVEAWGELTDSSMLQDPGRMARKKADIAPCRR